MQDLTRGFAQAIIEPLCEETKLLLAPIRFDKKDRLHIDIDEEGKRFMVTPMSAVPVPRKAGIPIWEIMREHTSRYAASSTYTRQFRWEPDLAGGGTFVSVIPGGSYEATVTWFERVPERKRLMGGGWLLAATDFTAIIINALWDRDKIMFEPNAKVVFDYLLMRFTSQTVSAAQRARYRVHDDVPDIGLLDHPELPLAPYQKIATVTSIGQESMALFMEQGTGKTPCVISRICHEASRRTSDVPYRVLVVCPKNVRANWINELNRFATCPGTSVVLRGGKLDRIKTILTAMFDSQTAGHKWVVVCASYESMQNTWDAISRIEWDLCVLDESHFIKWHNTKRAKTAIQLRPMTKNRMCLTGTPITNTVFDLWTQLEFLGEGLSGFLSFENFRSYYGKFIKREDGGNMLVSYQNLPILRERLARLAYIIRKEEALPDLPAKVFDVCEVEMTPEQADVYRAIRDQLVAEIRNDMEDAAAKGKTITVNNVLTKLLRLAQITSGFMSYDVIYDELGNMVEPKTIDRFDPNPKIDALVEMIKESGPLDKIIVWACFVQDIKSIRARLQAEGIDCVTFYGGTSDDDRVEAERRFNGDPICKVFIGNPAAGGTGLNLRGYNPDDPTSETNCNHVIYFSQNWSMTARAQSEDRAHRRGTRTNVRITDLAIAGTIDEEIRIRVTQKRVTAYQIQDIQSILERIMNAVPQLSGD